MILRVDGTGLDRTANNFFDSGAIMVGARYAAVRARIPFSCYGSRLDCHAWREGIVTTSAAPGPSGPYRGVNPAKRIKSLDRNTGRVALTLPRSSHGRFTPP